MLIASYSGSHLICQIDDCDLSLKTVWIIRLINIHLVGEKDLIKLFDFWQGDCLKIMILGNNDLLF